MYEHIAALINEGKWEEAASAFLNLPSDEFSDELAILSATLFLHAGDEEAAYDSICAGLEYNCTNYELFLLLGSYYEKLNPAQAWLCYENAAFYCDKAEDLEVIHQFMESLAHTVSSSEAGCTALPNNTSIVILSYNSLSYTRQCIESIMAYTPPSYEIIVVDNASSDGSREWLLTQKQIKLILNDTNMGFPYGCNQGIKASEPENDIFLLNSDTVVFPNSLFWLRMGLYENESVGAAGSITNCAGNDQTISTLLSSGEEYAAYARACNIPMRNPYELKNYLIGFALLLKRRALDEVGLLDTRFSPGTYEDNDIGMRLLSAGWKNLLCHNSFIFHYGGNGGKNKQTWLSLNAVNSAKLAEKWGFDSRYYTWARYQLIRLIHQPKECPIRVLEIGCGLGSTLTKIKFLWPDSQVTGIEIVPEIARLGAVNVNILQGNIETMELPFEPGSFDYIILGDVLEHLREPEKALLRLKPFLADDGSFLCSIPNIMHLSVMVPLLQGSFAYQDAGILDRTHLRFFTLKSIGELFESCRLKIGELTYSSAAELSEEYQRVLEGLLQIPGAASKEEFLAYQYIFSAGKES